MSPTSYQTAPPRISIILSREHPVKPPRAARCAWISNIAREPPREAHSRRRAMAIDAGMLPCLHGRESSRRKAGERIRGLGPLLADRVHPSGCGGRRPVGWASCWTTGCTPNGSSMAGILVGADCRICGPDSHRHLETRTDGREQSPDFHPQESCRSDLPSRAKLSFPTLGHQLPFSPSRGIVPLPAVSQHCLWRTLPFEEYSREPHSFPTDHLVLSVS